MSDSNNKHVTFGGKLWCSVFGHQFITSRNITNHFKEYKCSKCNLELTNDEKGRRIYLTPELKDINETLVRFYQKDIIWYKTYLYFFGNNSLSCSSYKKFKTNTLETILSIKKLNKRFGALQAVKNVSLEIHKGNVYGILGPNGSGKSTTLGIVLNVVNKTSGEYSWFGGSMPTHEALKKVGAIIERPNFYPYMTAKENLELVCKIKGINTSKVIEKLELVGLSDRINSKFSTFSLGMKQRLAIASALLNDPEILILDEPTNGLDPQGIHQIRDIIKLIASRGTTILLASHLLDEVEKVCTHVLVLRKGEILYSGRVDEMTANQGFFELQSDENSLLKTILNSHPAVEKVKDENGKIIVHIKSPLEAADLNRYLFEKGIVLNHLVKRKNSLEEQFLELTKTK